jgi:hypothetical protein
MLQMGTPECPKSHNLQNTVTQHLHNFSSMCTVIISISGSNHTYAKPSKVLLSCWHSVAALKWQPLKLSFIHWKKGKISWCRDKESMVVVKHHSTKHGEILMHKQHSCLVVVSWRAVSFVTSSQSLPVEGQQPCFCDTNTLGTWCLFNSKKRSNTTFFSRNPNYDDCHIEESYGKHQVS